MRRINSPFGEVFNTIHHFGWIVRDVDEALKLYRDILGFSVERDTGPNGLDENYAALVCRIAGVKARSVRIVYLQKFSIRLELLQFGGQRDKKNGNSLRGFHAAYTIGRFAEIYEALRKVGLIPVSDPQIIPDGPNKGRQVVYMKADEENIIELISV